MHWLATSIHDRIERRAELNRDIEDARRTLAQLEVDTWGLVFHEIMGERRTIYVRLEQGRFPRQVSLGARAGAE